METTLNNDDQSPRDLFISLEGLAFPNYREFDQAVGKALARYRDAFSLSYTPRQAITWAQQNGWIRDSDDMLSVEVH